MFNPALKNGLSYIFWSSTSVAQFYRIIKKRWLFLVDFSEIKSNRGRNKPNCPLNISPLSVYQHFLCTQGHGCCWSLSQLSSGQGRPYEHWTIHTQAHSHVRFQVSMSVCLGSGNSPSGQMQNKQTPLRKDLLVADWDLVAVRPPRRLLVTWMSSGVKPVLPSGRPAWGGLGSCCWWQWAVAVWEAVEVWWCHQVHCLPVEEDICHSNSVSAKSSAAQRVPLPSSLSGQT